MNVLEVTFGLLSRLGRADSIDNDWILNKYEIVKFSEELDTLHRKIYIHRWEENSNSPFFRTINKDALLCGARLFEWNINENGYITPCSYFSESIFNNHHITQVRKISKICQTDMYKEKTLEWELVLNESNRSTKKHL